MEPDKELTEISRRLPPPCPKHCLSKKCAYYAAKLPIFIWVMGGPGAGKGTQCQFIQADYGFTHLSTGQLLRKEIKTGSERSKVLAAIINKGDLVSKDVVLGLLKESIESTMDSANGFLIDGYPREIDQGLAFEETIGPVSMIIYLETSVETMMKRVMSRAVNSKRTDDNEETVQESIQVFNDRIEQILAQYQNKIVRINGERPASEVYVDVKKAIDAFVLQ